MNLSNKNFQKNAFVFQYQRILNGLAMALLLQAFLYLIQPALYGMLQEVLSLSGWKSDTLFYETMLSLFEIFYYIFEFIFPAWLYVKCKKKHWRDFVNLAPSLPKYPVWCLFVGLGIVFAAGFFSNFFLMLFAKMGIPVINSASSFPTVGSGIVLLFIRSVIVPAFVEEWMYRGIVLKTLLPYGKGIAILFSSLLFGAMHFHPAQLFYATCCGIVMAFFVLQGGSIWMSVLLHLTNNCIWFFFSYLQTQLSESRYLLIYLFFFLLVLLLGIIGTLVLWNGKQKTTMEDSGDEEKTLPQGIAVRYFFTTGMVVYLLVAILFSLNWIGI